MTRRRTGGAHINLHGGDFVAIVQSGVTRSGVRYKIDDSCAAARGTAEYEAIAAEQCRIAHMILVRAAKKEVRTDEQLRKHEQGAGAAQGN